MKDKDIEKVMLLVTRFAYIQACYLEKCFRLNNCKAMDDSKLEKAEMAIYEKLKQIQAEQRENIKQAMNSIIEDIGWHDDGKDTEDNVREKLEPLIKQ